MTILILTRMTMIKKVNNLQDAQKINHLSSDALIESAKMSLRWFVAYTKPDYDFQWFHITVCKALDKLYNGEIKKLMIFMPPQHGKSELSSRRFPAYALGRDPSCKIALGSYSASLSNGFNKDCQNIIDNPAYKAIFPNTKLNSPGADEVSGEVRKANEFQTIGFRGFLKTVGIKGALTGTPVDIGIVDDPFKDRIEANSETIRDNVWNWYQDVFLTRLHNDSKQLLLFTRWHEDDIAGRILDPNNKHYDAEEAKEWVVIALPALKEATKPIPQAVNLPDPREIDEALWESRHSAKKYLKRKRINPTGFQSLDQQRPKAQEGNKIRKEWFITKKESELPFNPANITPDFFIDGAYTEKTKNDETAVMSCYFNKSDGKLYIFNCIGMRKELYELLDFFKSYAKQNHYSPKSKVYIELKASGHPIKSMLSKVQYGGFNAIGINNKVVALGKYNRVENSEASLASGKVVLVEGGWITQFIDQCTSFPNGVHDDMVDVLCYAVHKYLIRKSGGGVSYE